MFTRDGEDLSGAVIIKKEKGFTSHDVVSVVRKILHISKVGHTGTLDPDAEGVLPILIGRATKLSDYIMDGEKQYEADIVLGLTTTTGDASGDTVLRRDICISKVLSEIKPIIDSFCGTIEQIPPMYSAVKIGGKKLYELARSGAEIERKSRKVTISKIEIISPLSEQELEGNKRIRIRCRCDKGTYIRTLIEDIGERLGCGAHTDSLVRTRSGTFSIEDAITLDGLRGYAADGREGDVVIPLDTLITRVFSSLKTVTAGQLDEKSLLNGNMLRWDASWQTSGGYMPSKGDKIIIRSNTGRLIGIYIIVRNNGAFSIKPDKMLI